MTKKTILSIISLTVIILLCGCEHYNESSASQPIILRLANNLAEDHPTSVACENFAQRVNQYTDGKIKVICYHNSELGSETETVEQLEIGGIDFVRTSVSSLTDIEPACNVITLPYIYENETHMWNVLNGNIGKYLLTTQNLANHNMTGLCWYTAGSRCFYSTQPLDKGIESLKNMKIRSIDSSIFRDTISSLGAHPVTMPFNEVYREFMIGNIDGAENNFPSYISSNHYLAAPYIILDNHIMMPEMIIAANSTMQELTQKQRDSIRLAAIESTEIQIQLWTEYEQKCINTAVESGCTIITPTDKQKQEFKDAVKEIKKQYEESNGGMLKKIEETPKE